MRFAWVSSDRVIAAGVKLSRTLRPQDITSICKNRDVDATATTVTGRYIDDEDNSNRQFKRNPPPGACYTADD